ncbi:uroporphyrinogen-III C-methyltransferase [Haemophilus influenzae]|uniref:Putative uroporphyrinogen-III C-methyltransferase n=1 Tax=Haemophilus influenzae TaxID=727 RepID=A0A2S9S300_HAEIF|nr:uroporphyrinogen-III C-methyltransferase [Haemophilus influenzae]EEW77626.1 phosphate-starvation-inducible protein PsiE [Haemophilus influenzae NT127]MCK8795422.1 uroporphyrinogen-III C-methyltransferase [Haemophilus influenzae]MCK8830457.1 uroporphyrinogen-III C-methyltransferase [Haemophilus influenzae]MCK8841246.1 uroporphyrinogen-III C-methyltransferase [Haemophilus influenzae]MCK9059010.1 uroporphyrinogen-III C-methyltransferase [Haemophilus influenzae]
MAKEQPNDLTEQLTDTPKTAVEQAETMQSVPQTIVKKTGTALSLLAILVALGIGGAGYYFGQQQMAKIQQKLTALENQTGANLSSNNTNNNKRLTQLEQSLKTAQENIAQLEQLIVSKTGEITSLQTQMKQVSQLAIAQQPSDWLFSEADFLLNNALRKLVLDNDVDTAVSLLKLADEALVKVNNSQANEIRSAINQDLKQLLSLSSVDQNAVMQKLSQLANTVDELQALNVNFDETSKNNDKLSNNITDWQQNIEKSATSFLNHFIRISPKQNSNKKELLAPNQDIYLRENIRLRLQLAIMAVPRQQNELYKQSLEAVSSWVRSYFDTNSEVTQNFLKLVDGLSDTSIYVDVPEQLKSLTLLDKYLNRTALDVQKVEIEADKAIDTMPKVDAVKPTQSESQQ